MGQKTHPIGFRLGGVQDWRAHWFASKGSDYRRLTEEDQKIRGLINDRYAESGAISRVEIERGAQDLVVTINTARPGIIIGRGGTRVDELRGDLEKLTEKRSRLNIQEIRQPELDATLVGQSIAEQLERRVAYRRAVRLAMQRTMQSGALGIKVVVSGRLGGAEIARTDKQKEGRTPLHTLRAQIDFAVSEAKTTFGVIGIKVWIYTGDMIPSAENLRARSMARLSMGAAQEGQGSGGGSGSGGGGGGGRGRSGGRGGSGGGGGSKPAADAGSSTPAKTDGGAS
jgi:small subunit ribosomal protein S3